MSARKKKRSHADEAGAIHVRKGKRRISRSTAPKQARPLLLPMNKENVRKLRLVLKGVHDKLDSVQDYLVVVTNLLSESPQAQNAETGRVLFHGALNPLGFQIDELRYTIKQLGGKRLFKQTHYDDDDREDAERDAQRETKDRGDA
jgi:hypothetical protein